MATYYVGIGGNDSNDGTSWATRKLTLNGAEDIPVAANDTVYVGPGVYREVLVCDVSGSSGQPITYIGDVTGENTDGVGGVVRVTGSTDDQTDESIDNAFYSTSINYRTFRGFRLDMHQYPCINILDGTNWIIEDCVFGGKLGSQYINMAGASQANHTIRRCIFFGNFGNTNQGAYFSHTAFVNNAGHLVENCLFIGTNEPVHTIRVGGITVKNCTFYCTTYSVRITTGLDSGQTVTCNNNISIFSTHGYYAISSGEITEDYNCIFDVTTPRTNTTTGSNSNTYNPLFDFPILLDDYQFAPATSFSLSEWSGLARIAGTSEASDDLFGITRPTTSAKKSWGAIQYRGGERETTTTRSGGVSIALADAGEHMLYLPVTATSTTISVFVYSEANYAGTKPQLIIRQPGVADDTTTDTGSTGAWNQLTTTLTPDAGTDYVVVILRSNNTATSGSYAVYFDDLVVT